jgi:amino acid transporter
MGATELVLSVLAFSAPIVTASGYIAFTIIFGGVAAPVSFLAATVILVLFAVGYSAMTRHIPRPGAFYTYITIGLGRSAGLGAAYLATFSYMVMMVGLYCFTGLTIESVVQTFGGPTVAWWIWAMAAWAIVGALGYFNIELSAKVLSVVMTLEVALVMIFNVAVLVHGGADGLSRQPVSPFEFFRSGNVGVALLFAMLVYIGFEATALYRDEVKSPNRTIPRATYVAVVFIGLLYSLTCYALVSAYGPSAVHEANANPAGMFGEAYKHYVGHGLAQLVLVLVATSAIASELSTHNVVTRYMHNLGADHALPSYLSAVHGRHRSPYLASVTTSALMVVALVVIIAIGGDPSALYGQLAGLGSTGVFILMALVSLAVIVWFTRKGVPSSENAWKVFFAPALASVALAAVVVLTVMHFELVVGGKPGQNLWLLFMLAGTLLAGIAVAAYFRATRPKRYLALGRADRAVSDGGGEDEGAAAA